jgi:membrane protease YdiL (CAAX protease family)
MDEGLPTRPLTWSPPVTFLLKPLLEPQRPLRAILIAWLTAFVPSIALGAAVTQLFPQLGQPQLPLADPIAAVLVVIVAPLLETLIMAGFLALLLWLLPPTAAVLVSALGWGVAHSLAAPAWGLVIWWPFLVFSVLYVTWRKRSLLLALAIPAATHALQNLLPTLAMLAGAEAP